MEMKDKIIDKLKRGAMSCGTFTTAYAVVTMLFFVPYVYSYGGLLVAACLPIAFVLPFVIMPVVYSLMHRFNPLLFGRYHLVMPISAALAALFFVTAFSSTEVSQTGAVSIFFGMTVFVSMLLTYRYCTFSVVARIGGENIGKRHIASAVIAFVGGACGLAAVYGFYRYDPASMYLNCAFVIAAACIIVSFVGYLATFNDVPVLSGKRVQSVKSVFVTFYGGINRRIYFSSLALLSAFAVIVSLSVAFALSILNADIAFVAACLSVVTLAAVYAVAYKTINRRSAFAVTMIGVCLISSAALFGVALIVKHAALVIAAVMFGAVGGALSLRHMCLRFLAVKQRVTSGVVFNLLSLTVCAAFAVALAVAAATMSVPYGFAYGFGVSGILTVVGLALSGQKRGRGKPAVGETAVTAVGNGDDGVATHLQPQNPTEKENV